MSLVVFVIVYVYVTDGGVEVSDEANFFHPYESLSLAFSAADTVASVRADHACAYFEATQLVGFSDAEARTFFGTPPDGYDLSLTALSGQVVRAQFVDRFYALSQGL